MRFVREHADRTDGGLRWGVEPICKVLSDHGLQLAPSTYYDVPHRAPTSRQLRDAELKPLIRQVHEANYRVYGARKVWLALNRQGVRVARCTVERLMRELGLEGARRGRRRRTTLADPAATRPADLVGRRFNPPAPDRTWVADFTYDPTWSGTVYVAFVVDAYARRILGWRAASTMHAELVLDALEHALWTCRSEGVASLAGLVHHSDAGSRTPLSPSPNGSPPPASTPPSAQ